MQRENVMFLLKRVGFAFLLCYPAAFALVYFQPAVATLALCVMSLLLFGPALFVIAPVAGLSLSSKKKGVSLSLIAVGGSAIAAFQIRGLEDFLRSHTLVQMAVLSLLSFSVAAILGVLSLLLRSATHHESGRG